MSKPTNGKLLLVVVHFPEAVSSDSEGYLTEVLDDALEVSGHYGATVLFATEVLVVPDGTDVYALRELHGYLLTGESR